MDRLSSLWAGATALAAVLILPRPAIALNDTNPTGLITETIASRERKADYDNSKSYGAQRVKDRIGQNYAPMGLRIGNFIVNPSAETRVIYDDNIYASNDNRVADVITELIPTVEIKSSLPRHVLNFAFGGKMALYADHSSENYTDAFASFNGALHIDHAHTLALSAKTELEHEQRDELSAIRLAAEPVPLHHSKVSLGLTRDVGRLYGTISATAEHFDYSDVRSLEGGMLDQDYRDGDRFAAQLRAAYRMSPGYEVVGKLKLLRHLNDQDGYSDLSFTGYEAVVGLQFESNPLLRWRLLGGYGIRDFDDPTAETSATTLLEGQVEWLPTEKVTIYGSVAREFNDFAGENYNGWIETSIKAGVEYEIYNNLFLKLGANLAQADFQGVDRTDRIYSGEIGLEYYMNKNWLFTFSYEHIERLSSVDAYDLSDNKFMIGAKLRF